MFVHWGLYSLLGMGEWILSKDVVSKEEYEALAKKFTAHEFDTAAIAALARDAGMKYACLTTRHHDGFSLYDTKGLNDYDAPHSAAGRDLVEEFVTACRAAGIVPFLYHTTLDWRWDTKNADETRFNEYIDYLHESFELLCTNYGKIGGVWLDGDWSRKDLDWRLDERYAIIRKHQPEAMIINNTGIHQQGKISHPEVDSVTFEQGAAKPIDRAGHAKYRAGEMCQTMNAHWGLGAHDLAYKSVPELITFLAKCRKVGANYLLNIGPEASGRIPDLEKATLARMGAWTKLYSPIIYEGEPTHYECPGNDFILKYDGKLYYFAHDLRISGDANVTLAVGGAGPRVIRNLDAKIEKVRWVDNDETLGWVQQEDDCWAAVDFTGYPYGTNLVVRVAEIELTP
jgi:alpha-L-fucosidase